MSGYQVRRLYAEAEAVAQVALDQGKRALGAEHPNTLLSVNNLALLYWACMDRTHGRGGWG